LKGCVFLIDIRGLVVRYGWRREPILRGVSAVLDGKHLLLGPNGSGKTTLFRALTGLAPITSGDILIDGVSIDKIYGKPGLVAANLTEIYNLLYLSAYDNLKVFMDLMGGELDHALQTLEDLGVSAEILRRRRTWELSAGQRKAFATALALASGAKHVLLDEPFEQLDPARKSIMLRRIAECSGTVVLNTHETWLINSMWGWKVRFIFEGRVYGPVEAKDLVGASLVSGDVENALLRFETSGRIFSILPGGGGQPLTNLVTLDRVYELTLG